MAQITAALVKELREITGAGMMDCKKALVEAEGDFNRAQEIIREKGKLVAAKRADRETTEGAVIARIAPDGKTAILRVIDEMSWYKLNVLQIHFTDGDSWTLEIPEFPELVKQGVARGRSGFVYGEKLQPFYYSTKDIQEIVAYAAARHVKVVPEIEMPGHFGSVLSAHPEFACTDADGKPLPVITDGCWGLEMGEFSF